MNALLLLVEHSDVYGYFSSIAGLSVLRRLLLQFQHSEGLSVYLVVPDDLRSPVMSQLNDARLTLNVTVLSPKDTQPLGEDCIYCQKPAVVDGRLLSYLVQQETQSHPLQVYVQTSGSAPQPLKCFIVKKGVRTQVGAYFNKAALDKLLSLEAKPLVYAAPALYVEITGQESLTQACRALVASLRTAGDTFVSRTMNRYVSLFLTRVLWMRLPIAPNYISVLTFVLALVSVFLLFEEGYWSGVWAGFFFHVSSVLDGCDGELARLRFHFSKYGKVLDSLIDDSKNLLFFFAVGLRCASELSFSYPAVSVAFYYTAWSASFFFVLGKYIQYRGSEAFKRTDAREYYYFFYDTPAKNTSLTSRMLLFFSHYAHMDMIALNALIAGLLDVYHFAFWPYAGFFVGLGIVTVYQQYFVKT